MMESKRASQAKELFDAFLQGDFGPIFEAVADDVTVRLTISDGTPLSGVFRGKSGLQEYFARSAETVETSDFEVLNFLEGGDQVAVTGRETVTVRRSGRVRKELDWVMLCTFRGEKISDILVIEDTSEIANAYLA